LQSTETKIVTRPALHGVAPSFLFDTTNNGRRRFRSERCKHVRGAKLFSDDIRDARAKQTTGARFNPIC
jgi:hypothetical protein